MQVRPCIRSQRRNQNRYPSVLIGALIMVDGQQRHRNIENKGHKARKRLVSPSQYATNAFTITLVILRRDVGRAVETAADGLLNQWQVIKSPLMLATGY